jgi:hypothetical protein
LLAINETIKSIIMENDKVDYKIIKGKADEDELEQYRLTFEQNGSVRDIRNLFWLHQQNLVKTNTIFYAMSGGNVAAIYTALPVIFNFHGRKSKALQSIDTITDKSHRGKGLFPKLAGELYGNAKEEGFDLVYGFPNENSAPGFFKKLGWISFGEAPFLIKPMRLEYFIRKFLGRARDTENLDEKVNYPSPIRKDLGGKEYIEEIASFDKSYEHFWQEIALDLGVCVDRGTDYMNWRYVAKPGVQYSRYGFYKNGALKGVIVFTVLNKHQGRIGYVMELLYHKSGEDVGAELLKYAGRLFKSVKTDAVLSWCFRHSFNYTAYRKAGYYSLPVKFRPQHLFLGAKILNEKYNDLIADEKNWYISYSDSDTV